MLELLSRPLGLTGCLELNGQGVAQVDEELDVEGGVDEPGGGQGPGGPVCCRVVLGQAKAQGLLDDGAEPDVLTAQEAGGQLGVEQGRGFQPEHGQAGDVLVGGVKNPLRTIESGGQVGQRTAGDGIDEKGADTLTSELDEIGVLSVAEAGGALGVEGHRALSSGQAPGGPAQLGGSTDDLRQAVPGTRVVDDVVRADGVICCAGGDGWVGYGRGRGWARRAGCAGGHLATPARVSGWTAAGSWPEATRRSSCQAVRCGPR